MLRDATLTSFLEVLVANRLPYDLNKAELVLLMKDAGSRIFSARSTILSRPIRRRKPVSTIAADTLGILAYAPNIEFHDSAFNRYRLSAAPNTTLTSNLQPTRPIRQSLNHRLDHCCRLKNRSPVSRGNQHGIHILATRPWPTTRRCLSHLLTKKQRTISDVKHNLELTRSPLCPVPSETKRT